MKKVLSIAGSDCSGGAGIQADIKTMEFNGVYAMSAITALTAQNTLGVTSIFELSAEFLEQELEAIFTDIYPDAIKIGMVASCSLIEVIEKKLREYEAKNVVLDPVMVATSGAKLISAAALESLKKLICRANLITPNIPEAEILSGMQIKSEEDMLDAGKKIAKEFNVKVLVKGGHNINAANDLLIEGEEYTWLRGRRIDNENTHGTGCTLSSAIAANLAKGLNLKAACELAKEYISDALEAGLDIGRGRGPLQHSFSLNGRYK